MISDLLQIERDNFTIKMIEKGWGKETAFNVRNFSFFYDSGGNKIKGFLSMPENTNGKLPVVIWNRGGNNKSGMLDNFLACGILGEIASWGYIVFASQYRDKDEFGGSDADDVINLIETAKSFEYSDALKIGMEGWSRGGMMSYLTLARIKKIKTCIIVAGLADLISNENNNPALGNVFKKSFGDCGSIEFEQRKKNRSAVYWPEKISRETKILFIHGTADEKILTDDSINMYNKLSELNGKENYELKIIKGGDHYLRHNRKEISFLRKKWFDENLK